MYNNRTKMQLWLKYCVHHDVKLVTSTLTQFDIQDKMYIYGNK